MAGNLRIKAVLEAEDRASGEIKRAERSVGGFARSLAVKLAAAAGVALVALRKLVRFSTDAVKAFSVQEQAVTGLRQALSDLGPRADAVTKALTEQASALQRQTAFGDESIIKAQTLIASFIKEEGQIKAATRATLDLAAAKGFDLVSAADLVAKTLGSSTNALSRYGIEVEGAVGSQERLNALVENVGKVFGGQAAAQIRTFAGRMQQLSNAAGDLKEQFGGSLVTNERLTRSLEGIGRQLSGTEGLITLYRTAGEAVGVFTGILAAGVKIGVDYASMLGTLIGGLRDYLGETARFGLLNIFTGAQREATQATREQALAVGVAVKNINTLAQAVENEAQATQLLVGFKARELRIEKELKALRDAALDVLSTTGIRTQDQLREALAKTVEQMEQLFELERQGEISQKQFEKASEAVRKEQEALKAVLSGQAASVADYKASLEEASAGLQDFTSNTDRAAAAQENLNGAAIRVAAALRSSAGAARSGGGSGGGGSTGLSPSSFPVTIGGGTFTRIIPKPQVTGAGRVVAG